MANGNRVDKGPLARLCLKIMLALEKEGFTYRPVCPATRRSRRVRKGDSR